MATRPETATRARGGKRRFTLSSRRALWAYIFLLLPLAFYLYIRLWPALQAFNLSLHDWNIVSADKPFIGLKNFQHLVSDRHFWQALKNTGLYTLIGVPAQLVLGLLIALLLERITVLKDFFRAAYFLPYITPIVAAAWVWQWLYSPNFGPINGFLGLLGLPPQPFLNSQNTALLSVTAVVVWQQIGFQVVLFLAGLQSIPQSLYDAAAIDGADGRASFWHITVPLLNPTIVFSVVIATIGYLQLFTQVVNLNFIDQGGPLGSTMTIVLYIYQVAFKSFSMGQAAAITVVLFVIILLITLVQLKVFSRRVEY